MLDNHSVNLTLNSLSLVLDSKGQANRGTGLEESHGVVAGKKGKQHTFHGFDDSEVANIITSSETPLEHLSNVTRQKLNLI
ncbi:hypothetical protein FOXB_12235 [Fusarium oxysporum f. sp. conglutinans Fo5176]|uniref:Uncharacterized protein n=1 Tax=Fusarium oxysporum (strain Fo5176) TaxID=660025 RepID=F9G0Q3_FUSOF|nr:hypothetical protein FOXB_12235 [Fusarium oxysporum f. sp. conglutinans Fo5176]